MAPLQFKKCCFNFSVINLSLCVSRGLIVILATTTIIATIRDYVAEIQDEDTANQVLMSFSLKRTTTAFFQNSGDEIPCIHGIRAICTILLYVAHKVIPTGHSLYTNRILLTEVSILIYCCVALSCWKCGSVLQMSNHPLSIILRMSVIYTDTFLLLSGVLTAYHMSKDMETKGHIPWLNRVFARFIRYRIQSQFSFNSYQFLCS